MINLQCCRANMSGNVERQLIISGHIKILVEKLRSHYNTIWKLHLPIIFYSPIRGLGSIQIFTLANELLTVIKRIVQYRMRVFLGKVRRSEVWERKWKKLCWNKVIRLLRHVIKATCLHWYNTGVERTQSPQTVYDWNCGTQPTWSV